MTTSRFDTTLKSQTTEVSKMKKLIAVFLIVASLAACEYEYTVQKPQVDVYVLDLVTVSGHCDNLDRVYIEVSGGKITLSLHEYIEVSGTMQGGRLDADGFMLYTGYEVRINGSIDTEGTLSGTWFSRAQGCKGVFGE